MPCWLSRRNLAERTELGEPVVGALPSEPIGVSCITPTRHRGVTPNRAQIAFQASELALDGAVLGSWWEVSDVWEGHDHPVQLPLSGAEW